MNAIEARGIPIVGLLQKFGHLPKKENTREAWYFAPHRAEKTASFKVDKVKNLWYDHSEGKGGNAFDLAILLYQSSASETLKKLTDDKGILFSFSPAPLLDTPEQSEIKIISTQELSHPALLQYLSDRKINLVFAKSHTKEVRFLNGEKEYFAIGFQNEKGGFELRNRLFKGSSAPKWYSFIKGASEKEKDILNIFEGFTDFLSCLSHYKTEQLRGDTIVLNSLAFAQKTAEIATSYQAVNLFLDNDEAGARAAKFFPEATNQAAKLFGQFKDFNDWLTGR